jgi:putative membrane fusion protein
MDSFIKRTITVCISLFLISYVVYQCIQVLYNPIKTEIVYSSSEYKTIDTQGITIRNESILKGSSSGYLFYTIQNGSRVSKDGEIAKVFASEADSRTQQQLDRITDSIEQLKEIHNQGTTGRVNLDVIDKQIKQSIDKLAVSLNQPVLKDLDDQQSRLLSLINKRQVITGKTTGFEDRIKALTDLKNQLASSFSPATTTVKSPVAGYFVSKTDGFENQIDFKNVLQLTTEQIQTAINAKPVEDNTGNIGKVVGDYKWYFACVIPTVEAGELRQGTKPNLVFPFVTDDVIPAEVVAVNRDNQGNVAVIFECSYMSGELSSIRKEPVQIRLKRYDGLRVPSRCIITNDNDEQGVYTLVGDTVVFKKVEILYAQPEYVICREKDEKGYLELYDDIIVEGKGLYDGKTVR